MEYLFPARGTDCPMLTDPPTDFESHEANFSLNYGSTSSRPGKFASLSEFAIPENQGPLGSTPNQSVHHDPIILNRIYVPHIIHIEDSDKNSRIHDRIMLVIRTNSPSSSMTCLSFCKHENVIDEEHCLDHAQVTTQTERQISTELASSYTTIEYFKLCISLEFDGYIQKPAKGVYINLKELWNIESTEAVKFAILGKVDPDHWPDACQKIIDVFSSSVGDLDRRRSRNSWSSAPMDFDSGNGEEKVEEEDKGKSKGKGKGKRKGREKGRRRKS